MDRIALPYTLLLGALFGTSLIASRFSVGQLNPVTFAGLRLSLASLGYITVYLLRIGGTPPCLVFSTPPSPWSAYWWRFRSNRPASPRFWSL